MSQRAASSLRWWLTAYGMALRAFPNEFRTRWGRDMMLAFTDRVNDAQQAQHRTPWRIIGRELRNVLADGFRERLHSSTPIPDMLHAQDIRYAFRLLARSPGFALLTIVVLAGGLGLSTFTFSFLYTAMMRPLPLHEGDRIVRLMQAVEDRSMPLDVVDVSMLRSSMKSVRDMGGYISREVIVGREGDRRVLDATVTDPVLFSVGRARPLLGRALLASDAEPGAEPVIVLAYRAWQVAFGEDRSIVNTLVAINGVSTRVVGVMPDGFGFPVVQDVWMPRSKSLTTSTRPGADFVQVFARLMPRATQADAAAEATSLLRAGMIARDSTASAVARYTVTVESFPAAQMGEQRTLMFTALNVLAALILLLALVNVTTLITARANDRVRETAVRLALGAPRARLVMQGMWEGIILCALAGVVGTAAAAWGLDTVTAWTRANMAGNMAFWWVWQLDRVTLLCAGTFVTFAIAVLGSVVSLHAVRTNVREVMQDGSARSGSRREGRVARSLIATQVTAVTVIMFVGVLSGLIARRVVQLDPGYDPTNLLQVDLSPSPERFKTEDARAAIFRNVQGRLGEHPAVDAVLLRARLGEPRSDRGELVVRDAAPAPTLPSANIVATLGALSTLGIDLVSGRLLETSDDATRAPVALVSKSLAAKLWGAQTPIGKQVRFAGVGDTLQWRTVVGIVSNVLYGNPLDRDRNTDAMYVPLLQAGRLTRSSSCVTVATRWRGVWH